MLRWVRTASVSEQTFKCLLYRIAWHGARGDNRSGRYSALAHPPNQYRSGLAVEYEGERWRQLNEKLVAAAARAQEDQRLRLLTQGCEKLAALLRRKDANVAALEIETDRVPAVRIAGDRYIRSRTFRDGRAQC